MSMKPDMDQWNFVLKAVNDIGAPYTTGIDPLSETLTFQGVAFLAITGQKRAFEWPTSHSDVEVFDLPK